MKTRYRIYILLIVISFTAFNACNKKESTNPVTNNTGPYFTKVKAIIVANCWSCHSSKGTWMGRPTAFDTDSCIAAQYMNIKAVVADPATFTNKRMPETGPLSAADSTTIVQWYNKGGKMSD